MEELVKVYQELIGEKGIEVSRKDAKELLKTAFEAIGEQLKVENKVGIKSVITFEVKDTPARICRNPKTGEEIPVPAGKTIKAKLSPKFKQSVLG